jgi:uncharacterized protein YkwD
LEKAPPRLVAPVAGAGKQVCEENDMTSNFHRRGRQHSRLRLEQLESRTVLSGFQPTAAEQLMLEQLNDVRANPAAYGASIGVDLSDVASIQPLAFDPLLVQAARQHAQDMNDRAYFDHNTPDGVDPGGRLTDLGVPWVSWGESSAAGTAYPTSAGALQALIVDAGVSDLGHRKHLLGEDPVYATQNEVGIGIVQGGNGPLSNYYTIDTVATNDSRPILTGVIFQDANGDGHYDIGEGLDHVHISVTNDTTTVTTTDFDSGGFSIPLNAGTYTVTVSGGGLATPVTQTVTLTTANVRANFVLPANSVQPQGGSWIALLYHDLLGRVPAPGEIQGWQDQLASGASRGSIVEGFLGSQEYANHVVTQWYEQYLHREPDAAGLANFSQELLNSGSWDSVRMGILTSPEYFAVHGATASGFVQGLYQELLGRTPSGTEASGWNSQAGAGQQSAVVGGFLGSQEFKTDEVTNYYASFLRRLPDSGGQAHFTAMLTHGTDERTAVLNIAESDEYYAHAQEILWIQRLYHNVLGRGGDNVNELGTWLALLDGGTDRTAISQGFLASDEKARQVVNGLYQQLLGRLPDASTLAAQVQLLHADGHATTLISSLAGSAEYYALQGGTDSLFVRALYRDLLDRVPTDSEVLVWLNQLGTGQTRSQVAASFAGGLEYQQLMVAKLFAQYLQRSPTDMEMDQFVAQVQDGATDAAVAARLLGSDEYFQSFAA